jgi:hypothetical protein
MNALRKFESLLSKKEKKLFYSLNSPARIQAFLDRIPYCRKDYYRSPLSLLGGGRACCVDGALFAAAAMRRLGHTPRIIEMSSDGTDDDHVIAVYSRNGLWGAIAKSNFSGLRFREAVYRNLRELILSYFESYYNLQGKKTLRSYTVPLNLSAMDNIDWMTKDDNLNNIAKKLDRVRRFPLLTPQAVRSLSPVDPRSYKAGLLGADMNEMPKIKRKRTLSRLIRQNSG